MKKTLLVVLVAGLLSLGFGGIAQSTVLTFDDIPYEGAPNDIETYSFTSPYGGMVWENFRVADRFGGIGYMGQVSGEYDLVGGYNDAPSIVTSSNDFDFTGVYLTGAHYDGLNVRIVGKNNGVSLYDVTVLTSAYSNTWFKFDFLQIDELAFTSFGGTPDDSPWGGNSHNFEMDNFTFNESAPVPEPATVLLLGGGLAGLAFWRRKKS